MNLLSAKLYDPSSSVSKATSALLALTAFDTTNLRLTVSVPAHGMLLFKLKTNLSGATTMPQVLLGVLQGATVIGRQVAMSALPGTALATTNVPLVAEFIATGLTPGSASFDAAYGVETLVAATNIHYGGPNNTTANDAWGAFAFEIWDPIFNESGYVTGGTAQSGAVNSITLAAGSSATNGMYDPGLVRLTGGTGSGQARLIISYDGTTKVAAVDRDWRVTPDATTIYEVISEVNLVSTNEGIAAGGTATTITLNANASSVDESYTGQTVVIRTGTGQDQSRLITAYVGSTKVATLGQAWSTNPTSSSGYFILPSGRALVVAMSNSVITAASIATDAITDAKVASDVTIASVTGAVGSVTGNVGGNVSGNVVGSVASVTAAIVLPTIPIDWITASGIATDALGALELASGAASEIATAVRTELSTELGRVDVAVSTRLATVGYTAPTNLTAAQIATGIWTDAVVGDFTTALSVGKSLMNGVALGTGLTVVSVSGAVGSVTGLTSANLDVAVSSRLASASYTSPPSAATISTQVASDLATAHGAGSWSTATGFSTLVGSDIRTAVGLASANIDSQFSGVATQSLLTLVASYIDTEVGSIKAKTDQMVFTVANQLDTNAITVSPIQVRTAIGLAAANLDSQILVLRNTVIIRP